MKVLVSLLVAFFCLYLHSIPNNEVLFRDSGDCVSISGSSSFPVNQTTIVNETLLDTLLYYKFCIDSLFFTSRDSAPKPSEDTKEICYFNSLLMNILEIF